MRSEEGSRSESGWRSGSEVEEEREERSVYLRASQNFDQSPSQVNACQIT